MVRQRFWQTGIRKGWVARPVDYGWVAVIVAVCTGLGLAVRGFANAQDITLIYLTGVVVSAARLGMGPGLLASVAGVAAFNFFFVAPYYTFNVSDPHAYVTFAVMLATSLVVGPLTAQASRHAHLASAREDEARRLYDLTRSLAAADDAAAMTRAMAGIADADHLSVQLWRSGDPLAERDQLAIEWVVAHGAAAGRDGEIMASAPSLYLPVASGRESFGVLVLTPKDADRHFSPEERLRFDTFAAVLGQALHRARRTEEAEAAHIERENERLRNVLLSSLSHDLRTPLTAMSGGLGALIRMRKKLPREAMDEVTSLWAQMERLQRFVENLLRMAALTAGGLKLRREPYMIQEIIGAALARVESRKGARQLRTHVTGPLPLANLDGALIEQVLINLLDNAIQHTAEDGKITLSVAKEGKWIHVSILDDGPGLPPGDPARLFDRFQTGNDRSSGTGLGLAICSGIVRAHGGEITATNGTSGGALFSFTLPVERPS